MMRRKLMAAVSTVAAGALLAAGAAAFGAAPGTRLSGTIVSTTASTVVLNTDQGTKTIKTTPTTTIINSESAQLSAIKAGEWVGVDSKKDAKGNYTAVAIHIFPAGRTAREGEFTMPSGDTMTNAPVASVSAVSTHSLTVTYQGNPVKIAVPANTQIVRLVIVPLTALKPQMHAMVRATQNADGSLTAITISVDTMAAMH